MKGKAVFNHDIPAPIREQLSSPEFAQEFLAGMGEVFKIEDILSRPAEFYIQLPDETISTGFCMYGVEFRFTGLSVNGRPCSMFHHALRCLESIVCKHIQIGIQRFGNPDIRVQFFGVLALDAVIETAPASGIYSNLVETTPRWLAYSPAS